METVVFIVIALAILFVARNQQKTITKVNENSAQTLRAVNQVNINMNQALEDLLYSKRALLASLIEVSKLKQSQGQEPSLATQLIIEKLEAQVEAQADRLDERKKHTDYNSVSPEPLA